MQSGPRNVKATTKVITQNGKLQNHNIMANQATTTYKVTGTRKAVNALWAVLQKMEVNSRNVWLDDLAKEFGIDYSAKHICVRGHIY